MLQEKEIQSRITIRENTGGLKQALLESPQLRIVRMPTHLEMECLGEKVTSKRAVRTLALFFRKYCELTGNKKLMLVLPKIWGLNMDAWDLISTKGFFGYCSVAFISTELYQTLLLRELERLNPYLRIFKTKEQAEDWFGVENVPHSSLTCSHR